MLGDGVTHLISFHKIAGDKLFKLSFFILITHKCPISIFQSFDCILWTTKSCLHYANVHYYSCGFSSISKSKGVKCQYIIFRTLLIALVWFHKYLPQHRSLLMAVVKLTEDFNRREK
jgi:hypothetical protein